MSENLQPRTVIGYFAHPVAESFNGGRQSRVKYTQYKVYAKFSDNTDAPVDDTIYDFDGARQQAQALESNRGAVNAINQSR